MHRRTRIFSLFRTAATLLMVVSCLDKTTGVDKAKLVAPANKPALTISDAARDARGISGFYFRPPMLPVVSYPGTFDPDLSPEVVVCEWTGIACGAEVARFGMSTGTGGETVKLEDGQYHANWDTKAANLDPSKTYRIIVSVHDLLLGFADVDVVTTGGGVKNVDTDQFIPLVDGRTLPIKFRAEKSITGRITLDPAQAFLEVGDARAFTATIYDLHDAVLPNAAPAWSISYDGGTSNATFDAGTITATSPGTGTVSASYGGRTANAAYTIFVPPSTLKIARSCGSLAVGGAETIIATPLDAHGDPITRPLAIHYASSDETIATAGQTTGLVTGVHAGLVTINASVLGVNASTRRLVYTDGSSITIRPGGDDDATSLSLHPDDVAQLTGKYNDVDLMTDAFSDCRAWSSDHADIVNVDADGSIHAVHVGHAVIQLALGALTGSFAVDVTVPPPPEEAAVRTMPQDPSWLSSTANDVNASGIVVGVINITGSTLAFRWDGSSAAEILTPPADGRRCAATAINTQGDIVGNCLVGIGTAAIGQGILWPSGGASPVVLTTPAVNGVKATSAQDINDAGVIVGSAPRLFQLCCTGQVFPAVSAAKWVNGVWTTFGWASWATSPGGNSLDISDNGDIVGTSTLSIQYVCGFQCFNIVDVPHAFIRPVTGAGGDLGANFIPPNNFGQSSALGVNNAKTVVGWSQAYITANNIPHVAQRWVNGSSGGRTSIPGVPHPSIAASEARDVNNDGWIVGFYGANAFLWKGDLAVPAIVLMPPQAGAVSRANAVSQLFGTGADRAGYAAGTTVVASKTVAVRWFIRVVVTSGTL